jgi:2-polyprenyl-3-methyl-5-hydroxy-6-metoxy-1,4-benzoquinol methylase
MTDLFEEKAKEWDMNELVLNLSAAVGAAIKEQVELNDSMQVMDFGAGTGLVTTQIAEQVGKITAVDVSESMLDQLVAKEHLKLKVDAVCQDILDIPLDTRFDLIVSAMAMHHVEDTDALVQSFADHLKPGARIALADLDSEDGTFHPAETEGVFHHGFDRDEFQSILESKGFRDVNFVTAHTVNKEGRSYPIFLVTAVMVA